MTTTGKARSTASQVKRSGPVQTGARLGLAGRGLVWGVLGLLALSIAFGTEAQADQGGALRALSDRPVGKVLLGVAVLGFALYSLYLLSEAAVGHHDKDGHRRTAERLLSLVKALLYGGLAVTTARVLTGSGGAQDPTSSLTARFMGVTGGRLLVGAAGLVVLVVGVVMVVQAVRRDHDDDLDSSRISQPWRHRAVVLGLVGLAGRGVVIGLVGLFVLKAAWEFDPAQAKGLDAVLQTVAAQTYGQVLLVLAAACLVAFGLWSFVEAACRKL